ncbi:unnamed protein product [Malus baccata var. baccata]
MKRAFLEKFFPTSRVILLRKRISGIQQDEGESFPTYYERFKSLVASCPQHQMKEELLLQYFYEGLLLIERQMLDASAGGALVDKTPTATKTLIANRGLNAQQYECVGQRSIPRQQQVHELSVISEIQSQLANLTLLVSQVVEGNKMQGHPSEQCPQLIENGGWENANAIGFQDQNQPRKDPFSNTYNPGWRYHPNFKWREPQQGQQQSTFRQQPSGFYQRPFVPTQPQAQPAQNKSGSSIDNDQIFQLLTSMAQSMQIKDKKVDELEKFLQAKNEEEEKDVLETFRNVHVNIPLLDAIKQILKYAKCLKKLCTTRKRIREKELVHVSENVSAMLQRKLSPKCKDPDSFTIPCVIGNTRFEHAMLDLGASINVMPYSVYASMNLGELKNDDFYVLDMEDSGHFSPSLLLLGRPFMKTAQTKIDVAKGAVTMAFGGDMINFKISESVEKTNDICSCCAIDVIENIGQECSTIIKRDVSRTTIKEGLGLKHEEHVPTSKSPNLAENTPCAFVQYAATSVHHKGKPSSPFSIPISNNRLLPCLVQVPWCKDHYPLPLKDLKHEVVGEEASLHAVGSNEASKEYRPAARRFKGKTSKTMHFGAFWSTSELGLDITYLEPKEWTKLKI